MHSYSWHVVRIGADLELKGGSSSRHCLDGAEGIAPHAHRPSTIVEATKNVRSVRAGSLTGWFTVTRYDITKHRRSQLRAYKAI